MSACPLFAAPAHMPSWMTIPEWRALMHAASTGWLGYVFPPYWLWLNVLGAALLIWVDACLTPVGGLGAAPSHFVHFRPVIQTLCWTIGLHALCRSIDWSGKRKLARQIGLFPVASGHS